MSSNRKEYHQQYYQKNKEKILAQVQKYKEETEYPKKYYEANRQFQIQSASRWAKENKEQRHETRKKHRELNKDKYNKYQQEYYLKQTKENPKGLLLRRMRASANSRGLECTVTVDDIVIPKVCPILNIPLEFHKGTHKNNSISVDRIDTTKGYIPGNIAIISFKANTLKGNMTLSEIDRLYKYVFQS